jgi:hypothetical protein
VRAKTISLYHLKPYARMRARPRKSLRSVRQTKF